MSDEMTRDPWLWYVGVFDWICNRLWWVPGVPRLWARVANSSWGYSEEPA